MYKIDINN